jgi:NAD(P)-dependent dehydrogenase (short-subunit alcohol dehydrogenase family)
MTMDDRTVIVTGANAGLGYQTAKNIALTKRGYHVVLACRSASRGEAAAAAIRAETGNPQITTMPLDLASLDSVRAFAKSFLRANLPPLYGIICNAGISAAGVPGVPRTADGFEMIFGVNHLAHFLLTNLLLPRMDTQGRIVFVTSDLHDPPAFFPTRVRYISSAAIADGNAGIAQYCTSKLCNIYCTYEMARLVQDHTDTSITVNAFNPGAMNDTGFARPSGNVLARAAVRAIGAIMGVLIGKRSTAAESGAALAALITNPEFADTTGAYIDRGTLAESSSLSHDRDNAEELWRVSTAMAALNPTQTIFTTPTTAEHRFENHLTDRG